MLPGTVSPGANRTITIPPQTLGKPVPLNEAKARHGLFLSTITRTGEAQVLVVRSKTCQYVLVFSFYVGTLFQVGSAYLNDPEIRLIIVWKHRCLGVPLLGAAASHSGGSGAQHKYRIGIHAVLNQYPSITRVSAPCPSLPPAHQE